MAANTLMLEKLRESQLATTAHIKLLGFKAMDSHPQLTRPGSGFVIPYHAPNGRLIDFFRYRYTPALAPTGMQALLKQKTIRYSQPAKALPRVYFPRNFQGWDKYLADTTQVLTITEGELKAACACAN